MRFVLEDYLKQGVEIVERALAAAVMPPDDGGTTRLREAMRYSLLAGGKRVRSILALAACEAVSGASEAATGLACAIEMIHTYSLIHDDLPCMDDDDLRRGKPSNHKVYGEAMAVLAGDALLTDAFGVLVGSTTDWAPTDALAKVVAELAQAAGSGGMVGGQAMDIMNEGCAASLDELEHMHNKKTGALFLAAVRGGARLGGANSAQIENLTVYGRTVGLSFQVVDDILDVESTTERLGKRVQKDSARAKATYPSTLGLERSHQFARELRDRAIAALDSFDYRAQPLRAIAGYAVERTL